MLKNVKMKFFVDDDFEFPVVLSVASHNSWNFDNLVGYRHVWMLGVFYSQLSDYYIAAEVLELQLFRVMLTS